MKQRMNARVDSTPSESVARTLALLMVGVIGASVTIVMPGILAALIPLRGLSVSQAAMIASLEMVGMTIATVTVAPFFATINRRRLLIAALVIASIGHVGAAASTGYMPLLGFRLIAGFGEGALIASMSAAIATTRQPDRLFALFITINLLVSMALLRAFPVLSKHWGVQGVYGILLLLTFTGAFCVSSFPSRVVAAPGGQAATGGADTRLSKLLSDPPIALGLFATLILFIGIGMVWPLMGQLGASYGMTPEAVGAALGTSAIVGIISGLFTFWLGTRAGRRAPLVVGTCGLLATIAALALSGTASIFGVAAIAFMFSWVVSVAYYLGSLAYFDVTGRAATFGIAMQQTGLFVGPALAAALIHGDRFQSVLWSSSAACALAMIAVLAADSLAASRRRQVG